MMGKDCERIVGSINTLKDQLASAVLSLSGSCSYKIVIKSSEYSHPTYEGSITDPGHQDGEEKEEVLDGSSLLSSISSSIESFEEDSGKLRGLEEGLYTDTKSLNNSYGSPWTEIHKLEEAIAQVKEFGSRDLEFIGDKAALIGLLSMTMAYAVDAKWALITYHDYIQRGFDNKYNDNEPSIVFNKNYKTDELDVRATMGNKNQQFEENVHIKKDTYDPF